MRILQASFSRFFICCPTLGDRLRHLKFCEPFPQKQFGWALVHYPGRVDAMALKDFKVMSGIEETRYPHSIGPLVDTVVRQRRSSPVLCSLEIASRNPKAFFAVCFVLTLPRCVKASPLQ